MIKKYQENQKHSIPFKNDDNNHELNITNSLRISFMKEILMKESNKSVSKLIAELSLK